MRLALESLGLIADSGCWLQLRAHRRNQVEFPVPNLGFSPVLLCSSRYTEFLSLSAFQENSSIILILMCHLPVVGN